MRQTTSIWEWPIYKIVILGEGLLLDLNMFNQQTVGFSTIKDEISTKRMDLNGRIFSSEW